MPLHHLKNAAILVYPVAVVAAGAIVGVTASTAWITLTAVALLPAGVLLALWADPAPAPATSERLQAARR